MGIFGHVRHVPSWGFLPRLNPAGRTQSDRCGHLIEGGAWSLAFAKAR